MIITVLSEYVTFDCNAINHQRLKQILQILSLFVCNLASAIVFAMRTTLASPARASLQQVSHLQTSHATLPSSCFVATTLRVQNCRQQLRQQQPRYAGALPLVPCRHGSNGVVSFSTRPHTAAQSSSWLLASNLARSRRTIFIQTEKTPNTDALKFLPNHRVLPEPFPSSFVEYLSPRATIAPPYPSPLAAQLLAIDGVKAVFYGADFITVTKDADALWPHIQPEVFALITEAVTSGRPIVTVMAPAPGGLAGTEADAGDAQGAADKDSLAYDENDDEVIGMIKELLETRIRPAIQEDGGDIEFRGFVDGHVQLKLRGACRTCDSSTVTLKNGIEGMLMHYVS